MEGVRKEVAAIHFPRFISVPRAARALALAVLVIACLAPSPTPAAAAGTIRFASDRFDASEGGGVARVTVVRDAAAGRGEIRYAVWHRSADYDIDYTPVRGVLELADGQTQASFDVPLVNDPYVEGRETFVAGIYGAYPQRIVAPDRATVTIVDDDVVGGVRDPLNPLGLDPPPPGANPLVGARFFTNPTTNLAGTVIKQIRRSRPVAARIIQTIADQPETKRFGAFNDQPGYAVAQYLGRAQSDQPGSIPLIATYRLRHTSCGGYSDTAAEAARYKSWYEKFAQGIGNHPVVLFAEIDALITTRCLSRSGLRRRVNELRSALVTLSSLPRAVVYVDAGSALAHTPKRIAGLLRRIGVHRIQGFYTNATHQDWTVREIRYGRTLVRLLGGTPHYAVNTAVNGRGPLVPHSRVRFGNSFRCNAPGRGLGPRPTSLVPPQHRNRDGLFWIGNPGRSAGECSKTPNPPPAGTFWVDYAVSLVRHADYRIR